jgi:hypothetical protein
MTAAPSPLRFLAEQQAGVPVAGQVAAERDLAFAVQVPSETQLVTQGGFVKASTLRSGDRVVAWGGRRQVKEVTFNTTTADMFSIGPGVLHPSQPVLLQADQIIRISDARPACLFGISHGLVRVETLGGLAGVTFLGRMRHVSATITLAVCDAIFLETLWLQATAGDAASQNTASHLTAAEAHLLLAQPPSGGRR